MYSRPSLARSIPFWILVVGSIVSAAAGAAILADKIGVMTTTLTDGSATGLEVYVGQTVAVVGAVLVGAGVVGLLLALTVAALATLRPTAVEVVEPIDWTDAEDDHTEPAPVDAVAPVAGDGVEPGAVDAVEPGAVEPGAVEPRAARGDAVQDEARAADLDPAVPADRPSEAPAR